MRIFAEKPKSTQRSNSTNSTTRGKTFLAPSYAKHPIFTNSGNPNGARGVWTHSRPYVLLHAQPNGSPFNRQGEYGENPGTGSAPRLLRTLGRSSLEGFLFQKSQVTLEGQTASAGIEVPTGEIAEIMPRRKLGPAEPVINLESRIAELARRGRVFYSPCQIGGTGNN